MNQQIPARDPRLIAYDTLLKTVGWLGLLLPAAMIAGNYLFGDCYSLQDSNSHYYYTVTGSLFTGILCAVAMFLIAYKGYETIDNTSTTIAGIFALGIALLPTNENSTDSCAVIHLPLNNLRNNVHYCCAALFFTTLALISLCLFVKSEGYKTQQKKRRNKVYRTCGVTILICVVLIAFYNLFNKQLHAFDKYKPVFWLEWVALAAFGISWLVKGKLVLED